MRAGEIFIPELRDKNIAESPTLVGLIFGVDSVIHAYDNVSDENIWAVIVNHLPKLKKHIMDLLEE